MVVVDKRADLSTEPIPTLSHLVEQFLIDLANANRSAHTLRAYTADLAQFTAFCPDLTTALNAETLRTFFACFLKYDLT